jgi:hypothetical protein
MCEIKKKNTLTIDSAAILFNGIRVAQFFVFCVVFCELLVVFLVVLLHGIMVSNMISISDDGCVVLTVTRWVSHVEQKRLTLPEHYLMGFVLLNFLFSV